LISAQVISQDSGIEPHGRLLLSRESVEILSLLSLCPSPCSLSLALSNK